MDLTIAAAIDLKYRSVAVMRADEKPETAIPFKTGKWGCVMFMFANADSISALVILAYSPGRAWKM